jgi:hypothetical protein
VDPGETLLRLVTQSVAPSRGLRHVAQGGVRSCRTSEASSRCRRYIEAPDEFVDTAVTARRDLDRIFNTGGVSALVGNTYGRPKLQCHR